MNLEDLQRKLEEPNASTYAALDKLYLPLDQEHVRRTRNIRLIPGEDSRRGGKYSYAEWAHVIGIFQTLIFLHLERKQNNRIFDVGCGTGLLAIASEPFLAPSGKYIGIDVKKEDVNFCSSHYPKSTFEFVHFDVANAVYAPAQNDVKARWPIENENLDMVTALPVWTHLNEDDALFYFKEIQRVLKPNGKAIVTFFYLDEVYRASLGARSSKKGRFNMTAQDKWVFDQPVYGSEKWFHPQWAKVPENAVGVNNAGMELLTSSSGMKLIEHHQGNWKEVPGAFFQDVLIFQKASESCSFLG